VTPYFLGTYIGVHPWTFASRSVLFGLTYVFCGYASILVHAPLIGYRHTQFLSFNKGYETKKQKLVAALSSPLPMKYTWYCKM